MVFYASRLITAMDLRIYRMKKKKKRKGLKLLKHPVTQHMHLNIYILGVQDLLPILRN